MLKTTKRVSFKDLIIPCSVVVSDLQTNNVKVYSSDETPEDDVASAVRKSANIPIFFQPIENRYVDGGMLSNLPVFLYKGKDNLYNKVLAFTLNSEEENDPINNIEQYVGALINTSLFGNTSIQIELANGVNPLNINTGDIKTTDFDKINDKTISYLINQGLNSAKEFFDNEINLLKEYAYRPDISKNGNDSNNRITDTINDNISDIIFVGTSTKFVYDLFPTVYNWTNNGSKIKVLLKENNDDETHGPYRERLLKQLGAEIIKEKTIPFSGILINSHVNGVGKAIIYNQSEKENPSYHSKFYHGKEDSDIINILRESVNSKFADSSNKVKVTFEQIRSEELIQKIKDVPQYVGKDVKISLEEVKLEDLTFLTKFVNGFKFRQIQNIIDIYEKHEIELFKPMRMIFPDCKSTMITPPIIEKDGDLSLIIEGNTRITSLFRRGVKKCFIIVVQGVSTPVPSEGRFKCNEILITDNERKGIKRYPKFDHDYFRYIEFAVRNPDTCLL